MDPREMFAAAMTTCGSGLTGGLIVLDRLKGTGLTEMVTIPLLLACTIDAIGQPVGSLITRKYAGKLIASDAYLTDKIVDHSDGGKLNKWGRLLILLKIQVRGFVPGFLQSMRQRQLPSYS